MKKFFLLFFVFVSCTTSKARSNGLFFPEKTGINPVFIPYIESYQGLIGTRKYENKIYSMPILFGETGGSLGICTTHLMGGKSITIDPLFWSWASEKEKLFLMYHEFEHCVRGRGHSNKDQKEWFGKELWKKIMKKFGYYKTMYLDDGCPSDIMHSHMMSSYCMERHFAYYLKEVAEYKN